MPQKIHSMKDFRSQKTSELICTWCDQKKILGLVEVCTEVPSSVIFIFFQPTKRNINYCLKVSEKNLLQVWMGL